MENNDHRVVIFQEVAISAWNAAMDQFSSGMPEVRGKEFVWVGIQMQWDRRRW